MFRSIFSSIRRLKISKWPAWLRITAGILCLILLCVAIYFGLPMTGVGFLASLWLRIGLIAIIALTLLAVTLVRLRRRRRAAKELEDALVSPEAEGDTAVLSERMQGALATLRKRGGKTYLYDLPWYVIIGPPGAGKTTALANSGIEFPLSDSDGGVVEGFGGTRYCDWWFAEDAILIDTAGRYTTQDSDKEADQKSWNGFLSLLKKSRARQPINGVILAFSAEDMLRATPDELAAHAQTVRARLAEIHETLKIDFPVYVLFTKSDLISGFREYFASFSASRRKKVWGVTFQTKDRKAKTHEQVPAEFDKLVSRLSDELMDRLTEEPDGISRIAIFGLPGQMAMMRDQISDFLRRVFEPTRYASNAILRGFYFTSGTQEGTPIDQVLGAMARTDTGGAAAAFNPSFMSGKGKSFFLHDLLKDVIFAESDWVSHDVKAVRRAAVLRATALTVLAVVTASALGLFGYSYWQNANLVRTAAAEADAYERAAVNEINRAEVSDTDLRPILPYLQQLRSMPAGYGDSQEASFAEGMGLGQRKRLEAATESAYSDALERMLRPRLILSVERQLNQVRSADDTTEIYRALKVYMLLGGQGGKIDDEAVKLWFSDQWAGQFTSINDISLRDQLEAHLDAMLTLDDTRDILVDLDEEVIKRAREAIVQLPVVDQAYALIMDRAETAGLPDFNLVERTGDQALIVLATADGSDLTSVNVPAIFTYEGFWSYFFPELTTVGDRLREDRWVLGDQAQAVDFDAQIGRLDRTLQTRYRDDFREAWMSMLGKLELASMSADKPRYDALGAAASPVASPILRLVKEVSAETKLTAEFEGLDQVTPDMLAGGGGGDDQGGDVASEVGSNAGRLAAQRMRSRSQGVQRILFDAVANTAKNQARVNGSNGDSITRPIERIEEDFENWHLLLEGEVGQRPIDQILADLESIRSNLRLADANPAQSAALLPQLLSNLTRNNSRLPDTLRTLVNDAENDFRSDAKDATLEEMNRALTNQITFNCRENITSVFPFANSPRQLATAEFGKFFGPGGDMDTYFNEYLANHVERTANGLAYRADSALADRLSPNALKQFDRAEKIRRAFFASGSTQPEVHMSIAHVDSHSSVTRAQLEINGTVILTKRGDPPKAAVWPGNGAATTLALFPSLERDSAMMIRGGPWTIIQFLNAAASRQQNGSNMRATYNVGGRSITYDITINAVENPFTMRELRDFTCPSSLD